MQPTMYVCLCVVAYRLLWYVACTCATCNVVLMYMFIQYVCMLLYMYVHLFVYVSMCVCICVCAHLHMRLFVQCICMKFACVCMCVCICVCMRVCMRMCVYSPSLSHLTYPQNCCCVGVTYSVSCSSGHLHMHLLCGPMPVHLQLCVQREVRKDKWNGRVYI